MSTYHELLTHYWPSAHWAKDTDLVGDEIKATFGRNPPNNTELCAAVRWLTGPDWKGKGIPGLRDLILAVRVLRKQGREEADPQTDACGLCEGRGLVMVWPHLTGRQSTLDTYSVAYSLTVPCGCDNGKRRRQIERDQAGKARQPQLTDGLYDAMFTRARDQQGDRNRLALAVHAASGVTVAEIVRSTAKPIASEFDGMEIGADQQTGDF